jgi:hypothetical protein
MKGERKKRKIDSKKQRKKERRKERKKDVIILKKLRLKIKLQLK